MDSRVRSCSAPHTADNAAGMRLVSPGLVLLFDRAPRERFILVFDEADAAFVARTGY